jgi:carboxyl-terminal processing protease
MREIMAALFSSWGLGALAVLASCATPDPNAGSRDTSGNSIRLASAGLPAPVEEGPSRHAQASLINGDFSIVEAGVPVGWRVKDPGISLIVRNGVAYLAPAGVRPNQRARLVQSIDARPWRGKLIRLSARVHVLRPGDHVGLRINVDRPQGLRGFNDIMEEVPLVAGDWRAVSLVGVVEEDATMIEVGASLRGLVEIEIDDFRLEELTDQSTPLGPAARAYLDRALTIVRTLHMDGPDRDWSAIEARAYRQAAGAATARDTYPAIRGVLSAMGDNHSFLEPPHPPQPPPASNSMPADRPLPGYALLDGRYGYFSLPGLNMLGPADRTFGRAYVQRLRTGVRSLDGMPLCGWIIDLRQNSGGNMWPMLNGLTPLLGTPPFGSFVGGSAGEKEHWVLDRGLVTSEGRDMRELGLDVRGFRLRQSAAPLAVLIGPSTASSGEAVAIAFAGRAATRSFGQRSAGYTSANLTTDLSDGAVLGIPASWEADRSGREYRSALTPDEPVPEGEELKAARNWLGGHCVARPH